MPLPLFVEGRLASLSDVTGNVTASVTNTGGEPVFAVSIGAQTGVSDTTLTTIATLTANGYNRLVQISCSGTCYAKWELYVNSALKETRRSGPERNLYFTYNHPIQLAAADVVDIKVTHYDIGKFHDFEATFYAYHS
jgi:hypothetical protein